MRPTTAAAVYSRWAKWNFPRTSADRLLIPDWMPTAVVPRRGAGNGVRGRLHTGCLADRRSGGRPVVRIGKLRRRHGIQLGTGLRDRLQARVGRRLFNLLLERFRHRLRNGLRNELLNRLRRGARRTARSGYAVANRTAAYARAVASLVRDRGDVHRPVCRVRHQASLIGTEKGTVRGDRGTGPRIVCRWSVHCPVYDTRHVLARLRRARRGTWRDVGRRVGGLRRR